jgi:hypothetical protein
MPENIRLFPQFYSIGGKPARTSVVIITEWPTQQIEPSHAT